MRHERLAYDEASTAAQMTADCHLVEPRLGAVHDRRPAVALSPPPTALVVPDAAVVIAASLTH